MKKIKRNLYELKWFTIRSICKLFYRKVMIEQRFLREMNNQLLNGYQKRGQSNYEGKLYYINNRAYIALGNQWFIYANADKLVQKFFNV